MFKKNFHFMCSIIWQHSMSIVYRNSLTLASLLSTEKNSLNYIYDVIGKLPHENRDTLAFLVVHLQK